MTLLTLLVSILSVISTPIQAPNPDLNLKFAVDQLALLSNSGCSAAYAACQEACYDEEDCCCANECSSSCSAGCPDCTDAGTSCLMCCTCQFLNCVSPGTTPCPGDCISSSNFPSGCN